MALLLAARLISFGLKREIMSETDEPSVCPVNEETDTPWRKFPDMEIPALKTELEGYSPPSSLNQMNILLLGAVGSGKSSFYNTINSIIQGRVTAVARSGSAEESLTTVYRMYKINSPKSGLTLKIRICDTRGLEGLSSELTDILTIIDGHIPDRFQFNPIAPVSPDSAGFKKTPTINDRIHCITFVMDSTTVDVFPEKILQTFKAVQKRVNVQGIPQMVLLTKVDQACSLVNSDVSKLFHSVMIRDLVDKTAALLGLPRSHVMPIKSHEDEMALDDDVSFPALYSLVQMRRFTDDYLNDYADYESEK